MVRKGLQERIDALEKENAEHWNKDVELRNKIAELVEANNRAADVFCQTTEIMASHSDILASTLSAGPAGSSTSLPLRTWDHPMLRRISAPDHWQNQIQSSDISRSVLQNEVSLISSEVGISNHQQTDRLHCLQQLVLLTARSIVVQASPILESSNQSFDHVVWQQAGYAAVLLGTSMYERGDFHTDHSRVEATFQSLQRLRSQHPTDAQLETAAAKLHGLLHPENLSQVFARPFPLPQHMSADRCTAMDAVSGLVPVGSPRLEEMQQIRPSDMNSHLLGQQKSLASPKRINRCKQPLLLEKFAMEIPNGAILSDSNLHAVPISTESLTQLISRPELQPTRPPELFRPPLADPRLTSSASMMPPEIHTKSPNSTTPRLSVDRGIEKSKPMLQHSPSVTPSSAPATFLNLENVHAAPMTGQINYLQYHPPLNPAYFTQATRDRDGGLASGSVPGRLAGAQSLYFGSDPLQFSLLPQQSVVTNATPADPFILENTNAKIDAYNGIGAAEDMAQDPV